MSPASGSKRLLWKWATVQIPTRALKRQRTDIIALWIPDHISTRCTHVARELGRLVKQSKHKLTTLVQPVAEICTQGCLFLQNRLAEPEIPLQHALWAPKLAIRDFSFREPTI